MLSKHTPVLPEPTQTCVPGHPTSAQAQSVTLGKASHLECQKLSRSLQTPLGKGHPSRKRQMPPQGASVALPHHDTRTSLCHLGPPKTTGASVASPSLLLHAYHVMWTEEKTPLLRESDWFLGGHVTQAGPRESFCEVDVTEFPGT